MFKGTDRKVALSGMLGNGLEWYDYALYGHMSLTFSKLFFPTGDASFSLILTYLTFAAGFLARPLGAILFGRIGDKFGRKKALVASMILMAIPTGCIGLLPTYQSIGIAAPLLLVTIRILQGLSLGGAFSGSISYVVEHAPPQWRSTVGSLVKISLVLGFILGSLVATLTSNLLPEAEFHSWGWRIPFLFGVLIGVVGFYIRNHGEESPVFKEAKKAGKLSKTPVRDTFCKHPMKVFQGFSFYMFVTVPFYLVAIYMIGYSKNHLGIPEKSALLINTLAMIGMLLPIYPAARAADTYGRRKVMMSAILAMLLITWPALHWMNSGIFMHALIVQFTFCFIIGWYIAPIPAVLVELFPTHVRYTGMALSYNFCAIVGGFTPSIAEWLIRYTGDINSIGWLLFGSGVISAVALYLYKDLWREPLPV